MFFILSGTQSILSSNYNPPIPLDENVEYELALLNFETFNSIPNVSSINNKLYYYTTNTFQPSDAPEFVTLPEGAYEITDIEEYINQEFQSSSQFIALRANNNTLKTSVKATVPLDFRKDDSIGRLLGFDKRLLLPNVWHESDHVTNILQLNSILVECNLTTGSYINGQSAHCLYQFFPTVPPGYKIVKPPGPVLYLPISVKRAIDNITLKIVDQDGKLVNFRGETITVGLHLRQRQDNGLSL